MLVGMGRVTSAHELADWARCPRAWWYERYDPRAGLGPEALAARLEELRGGRGRSVDAREVALLERLLARHGRFAHGVRAHRTTLLRQPPGRGVALAAALLIALMLAILLWV